MQISAALVAAVLATFAVAAPDGAPDNFRCRPGTYRCKANARGWEVCTTQGQFVNGGDCAPPNVCKFFPPSQSPYCVPRDFVFP